jgi:hypothetical protein
MSGRRQAVVLIGKREDANTNGEARSSGNGDIWSDEELCQRGIRAAVTAIQLRRKSKWLLMQSRILLLEIQRRESRRGFGFASFF